MSPSSATMVAAATSAIPRNACKASTTGSQGPVCQPLLDLYRQPVAALLSGIDRRDAVLQHDMMCVFGKAKPRQPATMHLGPCGAVIVMTVPEQKSGQLLAGMSQAAYCCQAGPNQVAHGLVRAIRNPYRCELARSMQAGQLYRVPTIRFDPIARATGDQRWRDHDAIMASGGHLTLNTVSARAGLVANVEFDPRSANLAQQLRQRRRRVGNLAMLADFAALSAFRSPLPQPLSCSCGRPSPHTSPSRSLLAYPVDAHSHYM